MPQMKDDRAGQRPNKAGGAIPEERKERRPCKCGQPKRRISFGPKPKTQ
ncbi:MAG: hypothetical protein ACOYCE_08725 [Limnochordia bacterium]